jgi:hypothetical protein
MAIRWYDGSELVGFAMQDNVRLLAEPGYGYVTLKARYQTDVGRSWRFTANGDYAPSNYNNTGNAYSDFTMTCPGDTRWFSRVATSETDNMPNGAQGDKYEETFQGGVDRVSMYMDIHVGYAPHPYSNPPRARLAILMNQIGAYHRWTYGGPTFYPDRPRVWNNEQQFQNFQIRGQSWGITNYDDLLQIAMGSNHSLGIGNDRIRIINLGPTDIHVNGIWIYAHASLDRRF